MRQQLPAGKKPSALVVLSLGKGRGFLRVGGVRSHSGDKVSHLLCGVVCTAAGGRARSKNPAFFPAPNTRDRHPSAPRALSFPSASLGSFTRASERWGWPSIILPVFLAWPVAPRHSRLQAAQERRGKLPVGMPPWNAHAVAAVPLGVARRQPGCRSGRFSATPER